MEAGTSVPAEGGSGYSGASVAGAVLATLFFPLISLIVALFLLGSRSDPRKRASLRTWAWSSGGWLVLQLVLVIVLVASVGHSSSVDRSGPCQGGPDQSATGKDISGNGTRFVVPCTFGGTATVSFP
jgi:hypothetical protein